MKNMIVFALAACLLLGSMAGCTQEKETPETVPVETMPKTETVEISRTAQRDGKSLTIAATVEVPDLTKMEKVKLNFDEERFQTAGKDLVLSQYPDLKEGKSPDGYRGWSVEIPEQLIISFHADDESFEAGQCYYLDVLRDLNGQNMGEDAYHLWEPYYLTPHIPNKLGMTSAEAAEKMNEVLSKYSCFTYKPLNVAALNIREKPESTGYYQATLQPQFEGRPVVGHGALNVRACLSAEGMFTFQGIMLLKETDRISLEKHMTLEEAVDRFQEEFADFTHREQIAVNRITPGYVAISVYNGTRTLHPAWIFEYDDGEYSFTCAYTMENGVLHLVY